jgi:PPK2 family polyphosphate:nucleotide phosphotransferase
LWVKLEGIFNPEWESEKEGLFCYYLPPMELKTRDFRFDGTKKFKIKENSSEPKKSMTTKESKVIIHENVERIAELQEKMFASSSNAVLIIFQAMDAAGKDGTLKRLLSGVNPQGCTIANFRKPTPVEAAHDFLWRVNLKLPRRGIIGVFNRSHYEEVLVTRVHPEFILYQNIPGIKTTEDIQPEFWDRRFKSIRAFEENLANSGTKIIKFFLNVSKKEQKERLLDRMEKPEKNWNFNLTDVTERAHWGEYMKAYQDAINETAKEHAPWYVIPADDKDNMRALVTAIVREQMEEMNLKFPKSPQSIKEDISKGRALFESEE